VNPAHLDFLGEPIEVGGEPMALLHIYSEYPHYRWVDASGEGIAAVDDAARAAIVYLELHERTADPPALERARLLLNFVMHLQSDDGDYFNFVSDRAGTINREGPTSYEDWGWWAARGQWALARGVRAFQASDPAYAARLRERYLRGERALERAVEATGRYTELHGVRVPGWLLKGGSDLTSLALLGLAEFARVEPNPTTRRLGFALGQAVSEYRLGTPDEYPFGLRPSTSTSLAYWHGWGSHTVQGLAAAGEVFGRQDWIDAARREADLWFGRLLTGGMIREIGVIPRRYDQIAYAQSAVVLGYWNLYRATGDERYRKSAGLAAAWFFGDNPAGFAMYDAGTGRGYDGINGANEFRVNRNAGAESTIEALLALLAVVDDPVASRYLEAKTAEQRPAAVIEAEQATTVAGRPRYALQNGTGEAYFSGGRYQALSAGDVMRVPMDVPESGRYSLYVAHMRQAAGARDLNAEATRAPPVMAIDGALEEWTAAPRILVDSSVNVLRGGSAWPGRDLASFEGAFMWDDLNLYVAATVRDPEHAQRNVGPGVWQGDALWLYLDTSGEGTRLAAKLTLAQTPSGPQAWNWVANAFQPGSTVGWRETRGGYTYEAAMSWESLARSPRPGSRLRFEMGMGFPGGFLDWTGTDPDTPGNLAPLLVVEKASARPGNAPEQPAGKPDSIALAIQLDGQRPVILPELRSPDRDHLWLDRVGTEVMLARGAHEIRFAYAGTDPMGESVVDAFWLQPVVWRKVWRLADGGLVEMELDTRTGRLTVEDGDGG